MDFIREQNNSLYKDDLERIIKGVEMIIKRLKENDKYYININRVNEADAKYLSKILIEKGVDEERILVNVNIRNYDGDAFLVVGYYVTNNPNGI